MSAHPLSSLPENTKPLTTEDTEEHREKPFTTKDTKDHGGEPKFFPGEEPKSVLDEPWRVKLLPEPARLPPGVLPAPDLEAVRALPWRKGDVARLKDDTPEGMMRYIAAHTTGWWREMAERALRDTEKATRMVEEAGWQPGQYWSLELDAEQKQKLLEQEEAKRVREEEARSKELAEKEAFTRRQMELLEKAGKAPRCEYVYTDGRGCRAPQVKGERWCHGHARMMSYRPEKLEMLPLEDENAVIVNLYRVTKSLLAGRITEKMAGLMLWSVAIGAPGAGRIAGIARNSSEIARDRKGKDKVSGGASRGLDDSHLIKPTPGLLGAPGSTPRNTGASLTVTSGGAAKITRRGLVDSGVTNGKSFVSGDGGRGTPQVRKQHSRENSLKRHGHNRRSRDFSTPPRGAAACSESLKMTRVKGCRKTAEHREVGIQKCIDGSTRATSPSTSSGSVALAHHDKGCECRPKGLLHPKRPRDGSGFAHHDKTRGALSSRKANACAESIKMRRGKELRKAIEHRNGSIRGSTSHPLTPSSSNRLNRIGGL